MTIDPSPFRDSECIYEQNTCFTCTKTNDAPRNCIETAPNLQVKEHPWVLEVGRESLYEHYDKSDRIPAISPDFTWRPRVETQQIWPTRQTLGLKPIELHKMVKASRLVFSETVGSQQHRSDRWVGNVFDRSFALHVRPFIPFSSGLVLESDGSKCMACVEWFFGTAWLKPNASRQRTDPDPQAVGIFSVCLQL